MQLKKNLIFRTIFVSLVLVPAFLCQTIVPIFSTDTWEGLAEKFYLYSLCFQQPPQVPEDALSNDNDQKKPRVAIVKVGNKSQEKLGAVVPRVYYQNLLQKLEENGNPHIISLINFETMAKPLPKNRRVKLKEMRTHKKQMEQDKRWALSVKAYRNFISSGLSIHPDDSKPVLGNFEENNLIPEILLSSNGKPEQAPDLIDLSVLENSKYLQAAKAFGPRPYFAANGSAYCYYPYHSIDGESIVIPSSLLWATAFSSTKSFSTWKNARWPRPGEGRKAFKGMMKIAPRHCFATPSIKTADFLKIRQIKSYELVDVLEWESNPELARVPLKRAIAGKIVVLANSSFDMDADQESPYIDMNYQEVARAVDEFLNDVSIKRLPVTAYSNFSWWTFVIAAFLILLFFIASLAHIFLCNFLVFIGISVFSILQLSHNREFMIPIQPLVYSLVSTCSCFVYMLGINTYISRRLERFSDRLRSRLSQAVDLEDLKNGAHKICSSEFKTFKIFFLGFNAELYDAAKDFKQAKEYLKKLLSEQPNIDKALFSHTSRVSEHQTFSTVMTSIKKMPKKDMKRFGELAVQTKLAIPATGTRLGTVDLYLVYEPYEEGFVPRMLNILQHELSINWYRVEKLSKRKLRDYFLINEKAQKETAGKFLANVVLNKFNPKKSMLENLDEALMPRTCRVAMLQADIRGFEHIAEEHGSPKMMETLRLYYKNVVDAAQQIAQVKLIGDCIFLFIEENASPRSEVSHTDIAVHFAGLLIRESERLNEANPTAPNLEFSIAIHTGNVVVGNLTSDQSIDYTVVGENVNLVGKLQEINKIPRVHDVIGMNAVLLSTEAKNDLRLFSMSKLPILNLDEVRVKVRSFPDINTVHYVNKEMAIKIANQATVKRMINPNLPLTS